MNDAVHLVYVMGVSSYCLRLRVPDCNVIVEEGGGPDARSGSDLARGPEVAT